MPGGWDELPERAPPSRPFRNEDAERLRAGLPLEAADAAPLPTEPDAGWEALGARAFFEHPLRVDGALEAALAAQRPDAYGFLADGDAWIGLAVVVEDGVARVAPTCAQCHAGPAADGGVSAVRSNRAMDVGAIRLAAVGVVGDPPPELDATPLGDLARLGPGRSDVLPDGAFDPYAFPDLGGIVDLPRLQHTGNWAQRDVHTLAVRCETLLITADGERSRPPRALAWALSSFLRSLPPPPGDGSDLDVQGQVVFEEAGCVRCHPAPLYASDRVVDVEEIGTDPTAATSPARGLGGYRVPSLRGVAGNAPYLHDGSVATLESMLDPDRSAPGHPWGQDLSAGDRARLVAFLRSR